MKKEAFSKLKCHAHQEHDKPINTNKKDKRCVRGHSQNKEEERWTVINNERRTSSDEKSSATNEGQPRLPELTKDRCKCDAQAAPLHITPALQFQQKHPGSV